MKLSPYLTQQIMDKIKQELFIHWYNSKKSDWKDKDMQEMWDDYHVIIEKNVNVVE